MKKSIITRTINNNACACLFFENDKVVNEIVYVPAMFDTVDKAEKRIRKTAPEYKKLIAVTDISEKSELRGMYEEDFIKYSRKADARGIETRNCITKEISVFTANIMLVKADNTVTSGDVELPVGLNTVEKVEKFLRKNKQLVPAGWYFVKVNGIKEKTAIHYMTESEFIKLSFPMTDRVTKG